MNHEIYTNELDENTKLLIEKLEKKLDEKDHEIDSKDQEMQNLKNELAFFKNQVLNKNRKIFGASSEQVNTNQIYFFNEAENSSDSKVSEPTVEEHVTYSYACKSCEKETGDSKLSSTKAPTTIFYNSMASNELVAHTISLKYQHALPLYRQQAYFDMMGVSLSRQTLSNWVMVAAKAVRPIYNHMKSNLLKSNYIHADETTLKVIKDNGSESKSKKYMWLYLSCEKSKPIAIFEYQNTRSGSHPKKFLVDFKGFLQTDGYKGYNSVEKATRIYCLAHIRRYFHEIIVDLDEEALKNSRRIIGFNYCEKIYALEKSLREKYSSDENYYDMRYKIRNEKLAPIIDDFITYVETEIKNTIPKSPLGKTLNYAKDTLQGLKNVLLEGSLEIDNNAAERAIKPFVIERKEIINPSKVRAYAKLLYWDILIYLKL